MPYSTFKFSELVDISAKINRALLKEEPGEPFHPAYKRNKKAFKKIIQSEIRAERAFKKHFKQLSKDVFTVIDWNEYTRRATKLSIAGSLTDFVWEQSRIAITTILVDEFGEVFEIGGQTEEQTAGIDIGFSRYMPESVKALNNYTTPLSKTITKSSLTRVERALQQSILVGETVDQATIRMEAIVNDPRRAGTIARTESVRAFGIGRRTYAAEALAKKKRVVNTISPCPTCIGAATLGWVDFDYKYEGVSNLELGVPLHPNCRCYDEYKY